jgi:hypothetical protein
MGVLRESQASVPFGSE